MALTASQKKIGGFLLFAGIAGYLAYAGIDLVSRSKHNQSGGTVPTYKLTSTGYEEADEVEVGKEEYSRELRFSGYGCLFVSLLSAVHSYRILKQRTDVFEFS